jgi:hypothetical protein
MWPRAQQPKKRPSGPRYYRMPPLGGLLFVFVLVVVLMVFLFKIG